MADEVNQVVLTYTIGLTVTLHCSAMFSHLYYGKSQLFGQVLPLILLCKSQWIRCLALYLKLL